jgi:hypothetical protein
MIRLSNLIKNKIKLIRENTNTTQLTITANRLSSLLSKENIPHFIVGGYAIQEYGYARSTNDIDIIVPNRQAAIDYLSINGFVEVRGNKMKLIDRTNKVDVDILEGGEKLSSKSNVPLPIPKKVTSKPNVIDIISLFNLKLDSYSTSSDRLQDGADVGKLIVLHKLPLKLYSKLNIHVQDAYREIWNKFNF